MRQWLGVDSTAASAPENIVRRSTAPVLPAALATMKFVLANDDRNYKSPFVDK